MTPALEAEQAFPELVAWATRLDARGVRAAEAPASVVRRQGRRLLAAPAVVLCWWSTAASAVLAFVTAPVLDGWRLEVNSAGTRLSALSLGWTAVCAVVAVVTTVLWVRRRLAPSPFAQALLAALDEGKDARAAVRAAAGLDATEDDDETLRVEVAVRLGAPLGDAAAALFAVPEADVGRGLRRFATAVAQRPRIAVRAAAFEVLAVVVSAVTCLLLFWNSLSGALGL